MPTVILSSLSVLPCYDPGRENMASTYNLKLLRSNTDF